MKKLRIRRIDRSNWINWSLIVLKTMRQVFTHRLWWTAKDFDKCLESEKYIFRLATIKNKFVGFAFGFMVQPEKELGKMPDGSKVIHLFYLFIDPSFQGNGYGFELLKDFAWQSKKREFSKLTGMVKQGKSLANRHKLGTKELRVDKNYDNTGETYIFCVTDLESIKANRQQ